MASCLAQEIQLAKHYEEVLSRRLVLLKQMESHLRDKDAAEQAWCTQKADAAHKKKCITFKCKFLGLGKPVTLLQNSHITLYWAKVEESIPKWEPFFKGRMQAPIGFFKKSHQQYSTEDQYQDK
ncbi:centrosomal protein 15 [Erythrolamprus reginae]|uniref:centrosomal protein 15 n=1 Tax=Erythrolamprus reginae TaxID=121349 RepID=UPI00396C39F8